MAELSFQGDPELEPSLAEEAVLEGEDEKVLSVRNRDGRLINIREIPGIVLETNRC